MKRLVSGYDENGLRLHLGCGLVTPDGWTNVDAAMGARLANLGLGDLVHRLGLVSLAWPRGIVIHDVRKSLPVPDHCVAAIYSSHALEHLTRTEGRHLLRECCRVLRPDGVVRVVVPDLEDMIERYSSGRLPAHLLWVEMMGEERVADSPLKTWLGRFVRYPHRCMYDKDSLIQAFLDCGLSGVSKAPFDSAIPDIESVE